MTVNHHHPTHPPTQTQYRQYLSYYQHDFDQALKIGSCDHLEQIPTVTMTIVQATFVLPTFVHIRNILAVVVTNLIFNQHLKIGSLDHLEQMATVTVTFVQATFVILTFVHIRNISAVTAPILTKLFGVHFLLALMLLDQNILEKKGTVIRGWSCGRNVCFFKMPFIQVLTSNFNFVTFH